MTPDFDEDRELCPDGACVGLLGPDGRCKVCGLAGRAGARERAPAPPVEPDDVGGGDDDDQVAEADAAPRASADVAPGEAGDAWEERRLCPDGACIGVIGPGGRCTTCGTAAV